jgi:hypothetical protein
MRSISLVVVVVCLGLFAPRIADACSPQQCSFGAFVPGAQGRVPANAPGLYWRPMLFSHDATPSNVLLASAASPTTPIPFTAEPIGGTHYLLVPHVSLAEGSYILADRNDCGPGGTGPQVTFTVTPVAAMPTSLGPLVASAASLEKITLLDSSGPCDVDAQVSQASIQLAPSLVANPWLDVMHFETLVDGKLWSYSNSAVQEIPPGASAAGRGVDRVFQVCSPNTKAQVGLLAGKHTVSMRAHVPGSTTTIMSDEIQVTLNCGDASDPGPDDPGGSHATGGCSAGGTGASLWPLLALIGIIARLGARRRRAR